MLVFLVSPKHTKSNLNILSFLFLFIELKFESGFLWSDDYIFGTKVLTNFVENDVIKLPGIIGLVW